MRKFTRPYVGVSGTRRNVFRASRTPRETDYPQYRYVIGPFRTAAAARLMAEHGENNPHLQTVSDAERLAKSRPSLVPDAKRSGRKRR